MESHHSESPISTLKVDFKCSKQCPMDVKKMLQKFKGGESISIDPNQGMVTVIGDVNPMMLVKLLQNMGQKAQLWSFDKAPMHGKTGSNPKQTCRCCYESDSEDDYDYDSDEDSISWEHPQNKALDDQKNKKKHGWKRWFGFSYNDGGTKAQTKSEGRERNSSVPPPMPWYQPVMYSRASVYSRPVPSYGYYRHFGSSLLSKYNPMIRYTSYADNYRYTV